MSDFKPNIDDLFKKQFENFKVEPDSRLWENIDKNLGKKTIIKQFQEVFQNYKVNPDKKIWASIENKLRLHYFLKFKPNTFNIYYLTSSVAAILLFFIFLNNNPENTREQEISSINISNFNNTLQPEVLTSENIQTTDTHTEKNSVGTSVSSTPEISKKTEPIKSFSENKIEKNTTPIISTPVTSDNSPIEIISENNIESEPNINQNNKLEINNNDRIAFLNPKKAIIDNVTIPIFDISSAKTSDDDYYADNSFFQKNLHWSYDLYTSPFFNNNLISRTTDTKGEFIQHKEYQAVTTTYSTGIHINYEYNRWIFQTGVGYSVINDKYKYENRYSEIDSVSYHPYQSGGYFNTDTIAISYSDSIISGNDTASLCELNWTPVYDTLTIYHYNSTKKKVELVNRDYYRYIEIPVIIGYQFRKNKWFASVKGGLITGILTGTNGRIYNPASGNTINTNTENSEIQKFHYSVMFSLSYGHKLLPNTYLLAEPYFRRSINSIYNRNYEFSHKFNACGIKLGMRYYF